MRQVAARADDRSFRTTDEAVVEMSELGGGVEDEACLRAVVFNDRLSEEWGFGFLVACASQRSKDAFGAPACQKALADIEPVDGEIIKDNVVQVVEARRQDPLVIPVHREVY